MMAELEAAVSRTETKSPLGNVAELVHQDACGYLRYYRDVPTDVLYMHRGHSGGLTVMLHPDGTPLLYSEWVEMMEGINEP